jgi:MFS family permease
MAINNENNLVVEKDENSFGSLTTKTDSSNNKCKFDYSYVVLTAAFIAYMFASLLGSCFGVIFDSLETELGLGRSKVAFIGALLSSLDNLLGPIASAFINRYGCRKMTILGGLLTSIGVIGSAFVTEFWLLGLLMGCVSGFGSSLVVVSSVVVATYYFEDKPSFASGFVISGGSLGPTIFPLIIIQLNDLYGRSGCFLILGGLILNIIVCGSLFKPLYWELEGYVEEDEEEGDEGSEEIIIEDDDDGDDLDFNFLKTEENIMDKMSLNDKIIEYKKNNHHPYNHDNLPDFMSHFPLNLRNYYYKSLLNLNSRLTSNLSPKFLVSTNSPLDVSTINISGSTVSLDCKTKVSLSCPNLTIDNKKLTSVVTVDNLNYRLRKYNFLIQKQQLRKMQHHTKATGLMANETDETNKDVSSVDYSLTRCRIDEKIKRFIQSLCESIVSTLKLFRIVEFTIFVICNLILCSFYEAPFYFINSYMTENDFTRKQAGFVNVAVGVAGIVASITYGYIGDIKRLNWILLYSLSIYSAAFCHFALPFIIHNYTLTMITMILISMFISVTDVLVPIICVNTVGNDDFVSAYGLLFFCQGISSLLGPPILGNYSNFY